MDATLDLDLVAQIRLSYLLPKRAPSMLYKTPGVWVFRYLKRTRVADA